MQQIGERGIELITRFEGLEFEAYQDIAGIWTIGYGHTEGFKDGRYNMNSRITRPEAEALLLRDLATRARDLSAWAIEHEVDLNDNEFDALISFIYNAGFPTFKGSTAAKRLIKGDRKGAAEALTWYNKARVDGVLREVTGLTRRRAAEKALFLEKPAETSNNPDRPDYHPHEDTRIEPAPEPKLKLRGGIFMKLFRWVF